ncbi:microtubule-associated tyrosine carboxypeptidase 1 isoform X2 [Haemorhous mexicanus]|uniref:microtubule-associated tyrosine carboxypeptidase 1 isoform X2 n=1 Tax=Haemorhous mexicanus TaxID=30427 RepID=UPI0028BEDF7C|nr:microtubule-associated tyrosine carboxypeptidase 1 isoform X2 [Haemorhous mexicanus]XP_059713296.1 microtubule-associated tyrosine carboxypeptidase 1 isoform X2 [Haemorhous mexicanus]
MMLPEVSIWISVGSQLAAEKHLAPLVVVQLTDDLLSQAVMMVEDSRPTLAINLAGARQHWLEGMLRHEIGTHYIRGVNNTRQPWHSSEGRKQYSLKPANPTEEGLASLHSVLFRKQPFLWRAALLYYTIERASRLSFSALFQDLEQYVQDAGVRWEYCVRAKRGQTDTSQPGCFSKDQVYLDGILRILRHRQTIDFPLLAALGKVRARVRVGQGVADPTIPSQSSHRLPQSHDFPKTSPRLAALHLCLFLCSWISAYQGKAVLGRMQGRTGQSIILCGRPSGRGLTQQVKPFWPLATAVLLSPVLAVTENYQTHKSLQIPHPQQLSFCLPTSSRDVLTDPGVYKGTRCLPWHLPGFGVEGTDPHLLPTRCPTKM